MEKDTKIGRALQLVRKMGMVRPRDVAAYGIPPEYLRRLHARGVLEQPVRGLYRIADAQPSALASLATVAKRVPGGVICLLSALRFHEFTTQSPPDVWLGIPSRSRTPALGALRVSVVRYSTVSLANGCETHRIEGVPVRLTNPGKTVADCFKYRNKIGLDVAIEALRECRRLRLATPSELVDYARANRVLNVMRPYLEALSFCVPSPYPCASAGRD
jgi:predicted transcriptional regulator of viral defense system